MLRFLLMLVLACGCCSVPWKAKQFDLLCESVVCIYGKRESNGLRGNGSGFVFRTGTTKALVLSCGHVAVAASQPTVLHRGHEIKGAWLIRSAKPDLAVLAFKPIRPAASLRFADTSKPGQAILHIGYANGHLFHSRGQLQHEPWLPAADVSTNAYTIDGMSGGPVLDSDGNVLGVITSTPVRLAHMQMPFGVATLILPDRHVGCAISAHTIRTWMASLKEQL